MVNSLKTFFRQSYRFLFCRGGHGIHSPFAFSLIEDVIEEKCEYYHFDELRRFVVVIVGLSGREASVALSTAKLVYRLAERYQPKRVCCMFEDKSTDLLAFALAGRADKALECLVCSGDECFPEGVFPPYISNVEMIFVDLPTRLPHLLRMVDKAVDTLTSRGVLIVKHIHQNEEMEQCWEHLKRRGGMLCVDLWHLGLIFYDYRLTPGYHDVYLPITN